MTYHYPYWELTMENRRIASVMYMKFNNRDSHGSLLKKNKKGIIVVNKPFSEVLGDTSVDIDNNISTDTVDMEAPLIWESILHKNYLKNKR